MMIGKRVNWTNWIVGVGLTVTIAVVTAGMTWLLVLYPEQAMGREQPIPFSHRLHVTDKQIDCNYCPQSVMPASFPQPLVHINIVTVNPERRGRCPYSILELRIFCANADRMKIGCLGLLQVNHAVG